MLMKTLRKIIIWIIVIIAILVIIAFLLPKTYQVERSITINADKEIIFDFVCDLDKWEEWTVWNTDMDSTVVIETIGICEDSAIQRWSGEILGNGEMVVTELVPYKQFSYDLSFEDGKYTSKGNLFIEPEGDGYIVTWTDEGDLGYNPIARYYGLMMDKWVGPDFEKGLTNLKEKCESMPDYPDFEIAEIETQPAIAIKEIIESSKIGENLEKFYGELMKYCSMKRANVTGPPYAIYYEWDPDGNTVIEAGVPVDKELTGKGIIKSTTIPGGKVVKVIHHGAYCDTYTIYETMEKYIKLNKLEIAGAPWEIYITCPTTEPDTAKWETMIVFPIK